MGYLVPRPCWNASRLANGVEVLNRDSRRCYCAICICLLIAMLTWSEHHPWWSRHLTDDVDCKAFKLLTRALAIAVADQCASSTPPRCGETTEEFE